MDLDIYTEYGGSIKRVVSTLPFSNLGNKISVPELELTIESGVGNADTPDPLISMDWSKDGKKWSDKRLRNMGRVGASTSRAIWWRLGRFPRFAVFRFESTSRVKHVWIKLEANVL